MNNIMKHANNIGPAFGLDSNVHFERRKRKGNHTLGCEKLR